jgi:hypothetical protein
MEINRSKIRRTEGLVQKEERKVIEHHPRYLETNRNVTEEFQLAPYDRVTNYDLVNRNNNEYQDIDDSYVVKTGNTKVSNVIDRSYQPGVYEVASRPTRQTRKSVVNPAYNAEGYEETAQVQSRVSNAGGALSSEYRPRAQMSRSGSVARYEGAGGNRSARYEVAGGNGSARYEGEGGNGSTRYEGTGVGIGGSGSARYENATEVRRGGSSEGRFESQRIAGGSGSGRHVDAQAHRTAQFADGQDARKQSYSSSQNLRAAINTQEGQTVSQSKKKNFTYLDDDDDDSEY